jgi:hypothetical protein
MSHSTTLKEYYWRMGINYDKATKRLLEGSNNRTTLKAIPIVLSALVETSVKHSSVLPPSERK